MYLIVGLGNPGKKYRETRHNVGFLFLDFLKTSLGIREEWKAGFKGVYNTSIINNNKIILLKPLTYMNLSGQSVAACANFYKISPENIMVISDDIDMKFGKVRFRDTGNAGGHNGLISIIECLGSKDFPRIKIGIDRHPHMEPSDWVLSAFSKDELSDLPEIYEEVEKKLLEVLEPFRHSL